MGSSLESMSGKIALITGGSRGIGLAIARRFVAAGAKVVVASRSLVALEDGITSLAYDVRDADACKALVAETIALHGRLDVVVNNAGGSPEADAATASPRFSERVVALNLMSTIYLSQAAHDALKATKGSIINISSVSAQRPSPGTAVYAAAKAGVLAFTRSVAHEWGPDIRINSVVVGYVETENTENTYGSDDTQKAIGRNIAAQRLGRADEIADAVLFLASDAASYITGSTLNVDGGGERPPFLEIVAQGQEQGQEKHG